MNKRDLILIFIFLICLSLVIIFNISYGAFESSTSGNANINIADWVVKINNEDITGDDTKIMVDDIEWDSCEKSVCDKIAPGMSGGMDIVLDATGTDTAIKFVINIEDARNNDDYILTVTGVSSKDTTITKVSDYEYYGILTLSEINNNFKPTIHIDLKWVNDEDNNERDSTIGMNEETFDYYDFDFTAYEYTGE